MIRFGIVGAGGIAKKFIREIKYCEGAIVSAIASRSLEKANEFKNENNLEFSFGSYEDMAKSDKIDAVYIATPHNFHMEQSILFMNNKKHVLCEKPISVNVKQFEKMVTSSKENEVLLMEAMWTRFLPSTLKLREVVASNKLGKFKSAHLEFGFYAMDKEKKLDRLFNPKLAGGSLLDLGVYPVAFTLNLTDAPVKELNVKAEFSKSGIDTECIADFVFEDDSKITCVSSFIEEKNRPAVLEFEKGEIIIENFWRSQKLLIDQDIYDCPFIGDGFPHEINSFVNSINNGEIENDIMTFDQTRKSMKLLDRIREAIGLVYPFE